MAGPVGTVLWASRKGLGLREDFGWSMRWFDPLVGIAVGLAMQLVVMPLLYIPLLALFDRTAEDLEAPARSLADRATGPAVVGGAGGDRRGRGAGGGGAVLPGPAAAVAGEAGHGVVGGGGRVGPLFGAMHFEGLQFAGLFAFGVVLAAMVVRTGRLGPAIWAHAAFNAATVVSLFLQRTH